MNVSLFPSILWTTITLILWSNNADFNANYSLNLTSLSTISEAKARVQFGQSSYYENQLYIHTPIVTWLFEKIINYEVSVPLFIAIAILSKVLLSKALKLSLVSDLLFSILYFGNPFLYQQVVQSDTRLFDLLLISLLLNVNKRSIVLSATILATLCYLRTQNVILIASFIHFSHSSFVKLIAFTVVFSLGFLLVSVSLEGSLVV